MITKEDLYDISYTLVMMRNDIEMNLNSQIVFKIIDVLKRRDNVEDNCIRRAIASIAGLDSEKWYFAYHNNVYVNFQILKNGYIYEILQKVLYEIGVLLDSSCYDRAYDLIDSIHCLPSIIADSNFTIPKSYWNTHVKSYRNKWDSDFLKKEQSKLKNG